MVGGSCEFGWPPGSYILTANKRKVYQNNLLIIKNEITMPGEIKQFNKLNAIPILQKLNAIKKNSKL